MTSSENSVEAMVIGNYDCGDFAEDDTGFSGHINRYSPHKIDFSKEIEQPSEREILPGIRLSGLGRSRSLLRFRTD